METKPFSDLSEGLQKEIIAYIEANQPEVYWDYNDELSKEQIELIFKSQDGMTDVEDEIYDRNLDHVFDLERDAIKGCLFDFKERIATELGYEEYDDEGMEWEEDFYDFCRDYVCVNMNIEDLINKGRDQVFFYDTLEEVGDPCFISNMEMYNWVRRIKKILNIKTKDFDKDIRELIENASYGGQLVVYFQAGIKELRECMNKATEKSIITFKGNVSIAITNTGNGSGHSVEIKHEFELPFNPDNLFFEDAIKYNYSWAVCGMEHDWCDGTDWGFREKTRKQKMGRSSLNAAIDKDREYKRVFDSGSCTFGDVDYKRHRGLTYSNNYPCGSRCPHCGTFFID